MITDRNFIQIKWANVKQIAASRVAIFHMHTLNFYREGLDSNEWRCQMPALEEMSSDQNLGKTGYIFLPKGVSFTIPQHGHTL